MAKVISLPSISRAKQSSIKNTIADFKSHPQIYCALQLVPYCKANNAVSVLSSNDPYLKQLPVSVLSFNDPYLKQLPKTVRMYAVSVIDVLISY